MNSENVVSALAASGGVRDTAADERNAAWLIQMWTLAGILEVNAVTITLTLMGTMVQDEAKNRLACFYMSGGFRPHLDISLQHGLSVQACVC